MWKNLCRHEGGKCVISTYWNALYFQIIICKFKYFTIRDTKILPPVDFNQLSPPCYFQKFFFFLFLDMRRDVQEIFRMTPHEKQVMMFSATLSKDIRPICKKFMQDVNTTLHYLLSWDFCSHPYPLLACRYAGACDGGWPYLDGCCCCTSWLASHPLSSTWPYLWSCSLPDVTLVFVLLLQLFSSGFLRHTCYREPDLQGCNDSWVECLFNSAISQCLCNLKKNYFIFI